MNDVFSKTGSNWSRPSLSHSVAEVFLRFTICRKRRICVAVCITLAVMGMRGGRISVWLTGSVYVCLGH